LSAIRYELPPKVGERLGENLRDCRKRAGISQEELAHRAESHRTHIGKLEAGERVYRVDTLLKFSFALGVPVSALLDGVDWVMPKPAKRPGRRDTPGRFAISPGEDD
jgi:transcriptional regulator with XRE-family HTH domain